MQLDCTDEASIAEAASQVSANHSHLDLLLNVAGILHIPGKMSPGEPPGGPVHIIAARSVLIFDPSPCRSA